MPSENPVYYFISLHIDRHVVVKSTNLLTIYGLKISYYSIEENMGVKYDY